jgi:hypothetical protein
VAGQKPEPWTGDDGGGVIGSQVARAGGRVQRFVDGPVNGGEAAARRLDDRSMLVRWASDGRALGPAWPLFAVSVTAGLTAASLGCETA